MPKFTAFTLKNNGRLQQLLTNCKVFKAFRLAPNVNVPTSIINQAINFRALWDTGASHTVISTNVVNALNLKPTGRKEVFHANGKTEVNTFNISLFLPNQVIYSFVPVTEATLTGFDLLIGMDIITTGDFSLTNHRGNTTFSFRHPSVNEIDYVEEFKTQNRPKTATAITQVDNTNSVTPSRNADCPCGSGKKYKRCCGS